MRWLSVMLLALLPMLPAYADPDELLLGKERGYPVGTPRNWFENPYRVGSWSAMDEVGAPYSGYGYPFWLFPMRERSFAFQRVHGQQDPLPGQERDSFWRGVLRSLGGVPD